MRHSQRFVLISVALAATVTGVPATASASTAVPCEQWYIDADHDSLWNNCDPDGRHERVVVLDTSGGESPLCLAPGVTTLAYGEVGTGNVRNVFWEGYC